MTFIGIKDYLKNHVHVVVLVVAVLILTTVPFLHIFLILGDSWQGILPNYGDELNFARVHSIGEGHLTDGNAYFLEHAADMPLVVFGGAWLNAIPLWVGIPFNTAMAINFVIWSLLFSILFYWLLRELRVPRWIAVFGTIFYYVQSFMHVWRPANMQPVYPFVFLFYIALSRMIREQSRRNTIFLGLVVGAGFYIFAYLWQIAVITLGLVFLYALVRRDWPLLIATLKTSVLGGIIGLPVPLYTLWLSHESPYFWESMGRLGLVSTHLPMGEVIYSGGWIGVVLMYVAILFWRVPQLRKDNDFALLRLFIGVSGLGLWILQGSNLITGKLLETGEHVVTFIKPWHIYSALGLGAFLIKRRAQIPREILLIGACVFFAQAVISVRYANSFPFVVSDSDRAALQQNQEYAGPYAWLQNVEQKPVVIWSNPSTTLTSNLPIFTRHFVLYHYWGMLELVPESEIRERYLVSQYFNNPAATYLKNDENMKLYLGRHDYPHAAKTIEREIKICKIIFFWDKSKDCGTPPTPSELLGEQFFTDLETQFQTDIRPNIRAYLKKYHVSYILKDKELDKKSRPETLGGILVYSDDRYEIYRLK